MGLFDKFKKENKTEKAFTTEIQNEIEEALFFVIHSGYYSNEEMLEQAQQIFEDVCLYDYNVPPPTAEYIEQTVKLLISCTPKISGKSNYIRLREIFDKLNKERIIAVDFAGYTMSDGHSDVGQVFAFMKENNIPRRGYCFYHQQDIERAIDKSIQFLHLAFHSMNDDKKIAVEIGERIVELLTESGFEVEWDKNPDTRIKINNFEWDKIYDGEDYGIDRAIRIMSNLK